jgi:hypothetical protein
MANPFQQLRVDPESVKRSLVWYQKQVQNMRITKNQVKRSLTTDGNTLKIGGLYLFSYDPKTKDTLPYYDTFPLVLPFSKAEGGFYGLNLHYLPYGLRFKLMGALMDLVRDISDPKSRAQVSWTILNNSAKYPGVSACVKRYLTDHVRSQFYIIPNDQWLAAATLPIEEFKGASKEQVFRDSRRMI